MAREFANTSGSPNIDYITYSGVPPVAGLATCSIVARIGGDSDTVSYGGIIDIADPSGNNLVGIGRNATSNVLYISMRNASTALSEMPFTFDGTVRSVVISYDGAASPKIAAYVDGSAVTVSFQPTNTTIGTGQNAFTLSGSSGFRFNGRLADIGIYNRVITSSEALQHAAGCSCIMFPRGLIFYAPLIRDVHDIVGGLTGTITGTTVATHPRIYL